MAIAVKRASAKQSSIEDLERIVPVHEVEEYQSISEKIASLNRYRDDKIAKQTELHEQLRRLSSHSLIDRLTTQYLSDDAPDAPSCAEQLAVLREEVRALDKAIQIATRSAGAVRAQLSSDLCAKQFEVYRRHARQVLSGMLLIDSGNGAIMALRMELEGKGYVACGFHPVGIAPWPNWGHLQDPGSYWRQVITEFRDRGIIDQDEFLNLASGNLSFTV